MIKTVMMSQLSWSAITCQPIKTKLKLMMCHKETTKPSAVVQSPVLSSSTVSERSQHLN